MAVLAFLSSSTSALNLAARSLNCWMESLRSWASFWSWDWASLEGGVAVFDGGGPFVEAGFQGVARGFELVAFDDDLVALFLGGREVGGGLAERVGGFLEVGAEIFEVGEVGFDGLVFFGELLDVVETGFFQGDGLEVELAIDLPLVGAESGQGEDAEEVEDLEEYGSWLGSSRGGVLDFEGDFVDAGGADGVEGADDIAVAGVLVAADEDAEVGVGGFGGGEGGDEFMGGGGLFVEVDGAELIDGDVEEIFFGFGGGGGGGGEVHLDGFEVDHAEAHEHEGGEEEEHDVDEGDDFDAGLGMIGGEFGGEFDGHGAPLIYGRRSTKTRRTGRPRRGICLRGFNY